MKTFSQWVFPLASNPAQKHQVRVPKREPWCSHLELLPSSRISQGTIQGICLTFFLSSFFLTKPNWNSSLWPTSCFVYPNPFAFSPSFTCDFIGVNSACWHCLTCQFLHNIWANPPSTPRQRGPESGLPHNSVSPHGQHQIIFFVYLLCTSPSYLQSLLTLG